ncbi:MAG TPA: hypothetical protein VF164_09390 [Trueperaceae bacterium]
MTQPDPRPDEANQTGSRLGGLGPGVFGPLLIGVGVLFLVDRLAVAIGIRGILWVLLFGLAAAAFMWLYASDRRHWWALLPGFGFVALAAAVMAGAWGGALLFGLAGAICIALYLRRGGGRWLLLAGGGLATLAVMGLFAGVFPAADSGWVLFFGLAATLFLLHRRSGGRSAWSLYLAIALAALGLISMFTGGFVETLIAVALIAAGAAMVWQAKPQPQRVEAPPVPAGPRPVDMRHTAVPTETQPEPAGEDGGASRPLWARLRRGRR